MTGEQAETGAHGRFGYVSAYDPERHMARIRFADKDNLVSDWLPVAIPNTKKNKDEFPLDVDEHVFCMFLGNGLETGIVLSSIFDNKNKPLVKDQDIRVTTFEDETQFSYDRKKHFWKIHFMDGTEITYDCVKHLLSYDVVGDIHIKAKGRIVMEAARIDLN